MNELMTHLNDALDRFDKMRYRELLLTTDISALTEDDRTIVEKWVTREKAMIEIEKEPLSKGLKEQNVIFERATEADPDFYYPPQREHAYTWGVEDYLIALEYIQQLRIFAYDEFIAQFFSKE